MGFAAWGVFQATVSPDLVMPLVATVFFVLAAVLVPLAWLSRGMSPRNVTYTDVAGALTLIGVFAAAAIEPEQMVRLIESGGGWNPKIGKVIRQPQETFVPGRAPLAADEAAMSD